MKKTLYSFFAIFVLSTGLITAQVGINVINNAPDPSAMLDVSANDKGLLIPRMTEAQRDAIVSPAIGLQIYNTDTDCFNFWNGNIWRQSCYDCDFALPSISSDGPVCVGSMVNLTSSSISGASYFWQGPNGFSSNQQNPVISNVTAAANGVYFLIVSVNGCSSEPIPLNVTVVSTPQTPQVSNNGPVCSGQTLNISATTIAGASYNWTGPNGFTSNLQNPSVPNATPASSGAYTLTISVDGCSSSAVTTNGLVNALPDAGFTYTPNSPAPIPNQSVAFTPNTSGGNYNWTFQSGTPSSSASQNPSVSWSSSGTYAVSLSMTDQNGCANTSSSSVTISPPADKKVFVTSTYYTGNLGGLTGADAACQARANAAGLSGTYMAWLSDASQSPSTRFTHSNSSYKMLNGTVIANNWADLVDGTIGNLGIDRTEFNVLAGNTGVFTNTTVSGTPISTSSSATCGFFTSTSGVPGSQGATGSTVGYGSCCGNACWTRDCSSATCDNASFWKLYCFEQ